MPGLADVIVRTAHRVRQRISVYRQRIDFARRAAIGRPVQMQEIDLERVFIGEQCGTPLERWIERTGEIERASCLLSRSPYVTFLRDIERNPRLLADDRQLEEQAYFAMAACAIRHTGRYFHAKDRAGIREQMRQFWRAHRECASDAGAPRRDFRHSAVGEPLLVFRLEGTKHYELSDGHHRAAGHFVKGRRTVLACVVGEKRSFLQQLAHESSLEGKLLEHVARPELASRPAHPRPAGLAELLESAATQLGRPVRSVLHVDCGYGSFVAELRRRGLDATGVARHADHITIGRILHSLPSDALVTPRQTARTHRRFDLVLHTPFADRQTPRVPFPYDAKTLASSDGAAGATRFFGDDFSGAQHVLVADPAPGSDGAAASSNGTSSDGTRWLLCTP